MFKNEDSGFKPPKTTGGRVKILRSQILSLSMEKFCKLSGGIIQKRSLVSWEKEGCELNDSAINRLVSAFRNLNLFVTPEWLRNGIGEEPKKLGPNFYDKDFNFDEEHLISQEILCFLNGTKGIVSNVEDDAMEPFYKAGDIVAGKLRQGEEIKKLLGLNCIVKLEDGTELVRKLEIDSKGQYVLIAQRKSTHPAVITNPDIIAAAEVVWIRRRDSF